MIKAILVIVTLPGTVQNGTEQHIPFETMEQCENAANRVSLHDWDGIFYCTTPANETWRYPSLKPKEKPSTQTDAISR